MKTAKDLFSHAATILPVLDVEKSAAFYRDQLGFTITFTWGDPVDYVVLKGNENLAVHLSKRSANHPSPSDQHVVLYIFVHDVDALYEAFLARKVQVHTPIGDRDYRMRDFDISDPDGHLISFGKGM